MKITHFSMGQISDTRHQVFLRMESLFDRWDMEKWLKEMTPNAEVLTNYTTSTLWEKELMVYCDATDASRIKLIL